MTTTTHTQDPKTCPACLEIKAMMKAAMSFEMKKLFLDMLKREQAEHHGTKTEKANGPH